MRSLRVLVTGATGFVGSHTARALIDAGHQVRVLVRTPDRIAGIFGAHARDLDVVVGDMTDPGAAARALEDQQALVHAAAVVSLARRHAARLQADNQRGVENLVVAAAARGLGPIVYVSSVAALEDASASSAYSRSKRGCDLRVRALQDAGAHVAITYPGAVIGPDDPGLSEANRGLLILFRDLPVVTAGGLSIVDVRDLAAAHAQLLAGPPAAGRHVLAGRFLPWGELLDQLQALTGRPRLRLPVPAAILRAAGVAIDAIQRVRDLGLPLTAEAADIMTHATPLASDGAFRLREPAETLRDTLRWLRASGRLSPGQLGALAMAT